MPLIDAYIAWFFIGDNQKEYYHCKSGDEVNEGKFWILGEVCEKNERNVEEVIGEEENDEKIDRKSKFSDLSVRSLYVEKLLKTSLVYYHLCDVFVFVLKSYIQR